ncbi:MAG: PfkB family carbohydrate kinase [Planctomycetaceae bacterium]
MPQRTRSRTSGPGCRSDLSLRLKWLPDDCCTEELAAVITLGDQRTGGFGRCHSLVPAFPVTAVDTTAAGDAFAGALAVRWTETDNLPEAVRFGNAAGAIAASAQGAQASMGSRSQIDQFCRSSIQGPQT